MDEIEAQKELGYVYINAGGRPAARMAAFIREALKQGVEIKRGSYTLRRLPTRLVGLNLLFVGPASSIDALAEAIDGDSAADGRVNI